jgi:2-polyprenyl-3-methyl-5-hydroxy-6-metoxy-1,4-benzoquinol methylase
MSKYHAEVLPGNPDMSQSVILDLVGPDKTVLDVGCAGGYVARGLIRQGCVVSGVEIEKEAAAEAEDVLDRLVIGDLDTIDLVDAFGVESFDAIVFGDVLEHLRDPIRLLVEARKLLKPRGSLVVSLPNVAHGDLRLSLLGGSWDYRPLGLLDDTHLRFFTRPGVDKLMAAAGFTIADMRRVRLPLFGTELGVRREDFPPDAVRFVEQSPEYETYQFVFTAFRDDLDSALAHQREALVNLEETVGRQARELAALTDELAALREATTAAERAVAAERVGREAAERELARLRDTRTMRWTDGARRVYGVARGHRA